MKSEFPDLTAENLSEEHLLETAWVPIIGENSAFG